MSRRIVLLQALATAPAELQQLLGELPTALAEQHLEESWALAEIVRHLLDVESRYRARLQRVVREERPRLRRILPSAAGYSGDEQLPDLLQQFRAAREETVAFLTSLPREAWRCHAVHPSWGVSSFDYLVQRLVNHDREHINQAEALKDQLKTQTQSQSLGTEEEGNYEP